MTQTTRVFDTYGTLFDVSAAARRAAGEPGFATLQGFWPQLAEDWRHKQLEHTFNGWDIAGARQLGFATASINRTAAPIDRLPHRPTRILPDLSGLSDILA